MELKPPPLPSGGETTQYQVPLELLVLARNKEKDKARSVAVTPVAPRPSPDEPPPSIELSALRNLPRATVPNLDCAGAESYQTSNEQPAGSDRARGAESSFATKLSWLLLAALCLIAGYYAAELLHLP